MGSGMEPVSAHEPDLLETRPTLQGNGTFLRLNGLDAQILHGMSFGLEQCGCTLPVRRGRGWVGERERYGKSHLGGFPPVGVKKTSWVVLSTRLLCSARVGWSCWEKK